jgi:hypothetical protein
MQWSIINGGNLTANERSVACRAGERPIEMRMERFTEASSTISTIPLPVC